MRKWTTRDVKFKPFIGILLEARKRDCVIRLSNILREYGSGGIDEQAVARRIRHLFRETTRREGS